MTQRASEDSSGHSNHKLPISLSSHPSPFKCECLLALQGQDCTFYSNAGMD